MTAVSPTCLNHSAPSFPCRFKAALATSEGVTMGHMREGRPSVIASFGSLIFGGPSEAQGPQVRGRLSPGSPPHAACCVGPCLLSGLPVPSPGPAAHVVLISAHAPLPTPLPPRRRAPQRPTSSSPSTPRRSSWQTWVGAAPCCCLSPAEAVHLLSGTASPCCACWLVRWSWRWLLPAALHGC